LDDATLRALAQCAHGVGLLRLAAVRLDHPGFEPAGDSLDRFVEQGRHGEMEFIARSREVRRDPAMMLPGARTILVAVVPYRGEPGAVARYAQSADYHTELHRRLQVLEAELKTRIPGVQTLICVDTKPVMERAAAVLAGLGFLGKNGCLITPGLGSYVLIGSMLCTAEWIGPDAVPSRPSDYGALRWDACGSCTRCLDACPTDAFTAPGELEPRRCVSYLTIEHRGPVTDDLAESVGERIAGCDACQEVCPYNAGVAREARVPAKAWLPAPPAGPFAVDLPAIATLRSGRYRAFVRGTALRRIPRRQLRRNALLALGNREAPLNEDERQATRAGLEDEDPQIRAAAARVLRLRNCPIP
jgi:epoxyqueuosine reductase